MKGLFLEIINMSISASWLILAVIVIRLLFKKAPKGLCYVLWGLVAVRLLCPISIESTFSLVPSAETFSKESVYTDTPVMNSGIDAVDEAVNPILSGQAVVDESDATGTDIGVGDGASELEAENVENIVDGQTGTWIWGIGILVLLVYSLISYLRLKNRIKASIHMRDNLWWCDEIQSPFIFGIVRPRIYLPSFIEENRIPYIEAHENEHLRYHDHWWKPLGFAILIVHWFNPLVWVAYVLLCRDIELACDERVIQRMDEEEKKQYSKSLLLCNSPRHMISACPVAFGEIGVKERIRRILDYKKPATWIVGIGILVCIVVAICFMTNPKTDEGEGVENSEELGDTEETENTETTESSEVDEDQLTGVTHITENSDTTYIIEDSTKTPISEALLTWFETEFFNDEENCMPNMFLTSEYSTPADIDLSRLFYGGANGKGNASVSKKEIQLLEQRYDAMTELDEAKITVQEMNSILQKYTGLTLEETNRININSLYYLEEYNAYYNVAGDTEYSLYDFDTGWINEDGSITLRYYDALSTLAEPRQVTLREKNGNYYFVSNIGVRNKVVIDVGLRDNELTLMQKVLFNKATYNGDSWIGDVSGIYWSEYGERYLEYVHFFNVDLDRDGVDEVCVEYSPGLVLIFHEEDGVVYAYEAEYRMFHPIYKDGTFSGSSSAVYGEFYGNVIFNNLDGYSYEYITSTVYDIDGTVHYYKGSYSFDEDNEITKEEYDQIMSNYAMEEVERYDFTVENILKYVK